MKSTHSELLRNIKPENQKAKIRAGNLKINLVLFLAAVCFSLSTAILSSRNLQQIFDLFSKYHLNIGMMFCLLVD